MWSKWVFIFPHSQIGNKTMGARCLIYLFCPLAKKVSFSPLESEVYVQFHASNNSQALSVFINVRWDFSQAQKHASNVAFLVTNASGRT